MQKFVKGYMADNNIKIQKQIQAYRSSNPKLKNLSDEQVASIMIKDGALKLTAEQRKTLFPSKNNTINNGTTVENKNTTCSITLKSGRKIVIKNGQTHYYAADGVELNQKYFEKIEGNIDVKPSGRYSVTKNGQTKYYAANGTELKASYFNQVENPDVKIKSQDGKTYNFNKTLEKRINNVSANVKKAEDENGFMGKAWSGFKNLTGIGDSSDKVREQQAQEKKLLAQFNSNPQNRAKIFEQLTGQKYTNENLEKFIKGEIKLKSEIALQGYKEGQEMAIDVGADIVSGIAAVGIYSAAVAAAPFTGGASIAVGVAAAGVSGAAIKTGLKAADAATGGRKYTLKDAGHDAATGAFSGVIAPITGGMGGAVGKTVATKLGIQAVKSVGKEVAETVVETGVKQGLKQGIKTALTNPTGYEYVGGNIAKRGAAMAAEMASDGAVGGAVDNAFRTALDGGSVSDVAQAAGEGFVGGAIMSPLIGGGFKAVGKAGHNFGTTIRGGKDIAADAVETSVVKNADDVVPVPKPQEVKGFEQPRKPYEKPTIEMKSIELKDDIMSTPTPKPQGASSEINIPKGKMAAPENLEVIAAGKKPYTKPEMQTKSIELADDLMADTRNTKTQIAESVNELLSIRRSGEKLFTNEFEIEYLASNGYDKNLLQALVKAKKADNQYAYNKSDIIEVLGLCGNDPQRIFAMNKIIELGKEIKTWDLENYVLNITPDNVDLVFWADSNFGMYFDKQIFKYCKSTKEQLPKLEEIYSRSDLNDYTKQSMAKSYLQAPELAEKLYKDPRFLEDFFTTNEITKLYEEHKDVIDYLISLKNPKNPIYTKYEPNEILDIVNTNLQKSDIKEGFLKQVDELKSLKTQNGESLCENAVELVSLAKNKPELKYLFDMAIKEMTTEQSPCITGKQLKDIIENFDNIPKNYKTRLLKLVNDKNNIFNLYHLWHICTLTSENKYITLSKKSSGDLFKDNPWKIEVFNDILNRIEKNEFTDSNEFNSVGELIENILSPNAIEIYNKLAILNTTKNKRFSLKNISELIEKISYYKLEDLDFILNYKDVDGVTPRFKGDEINTDLINWCSKLYRKDFESIAQLKNSDGTYKFDGIAIQTILKYRSRTQHTGVYDKLLSSEINGKAKFNGNKCGDLMKLSISMSENQRKLLLDLMDDQNISPDLLNAIFDNNIQLLPSSNTPWQKLAKSGILTDSEGNIDQNLIYNIKLFWDENTTKTKELLNKNLQGLSQNETEYLENLSRGNQNQIDWAKKVIEVSETNNLSQQETRFLWQIGKHSIYDNYHGRWSDLNTEKIDNTSRFLNSLLKSDTKIEINSFNTNEKLSLLNYLNDANIGDFKSNLPFSKFIQSYKSIDDLRGNIIKELEKELKHLGTDVKLTKQQVGALLKGDFRDHLSDYPFINNQSLLKYNEAIDKAINNDNIDLRDLAVLKFSTLLSGLSKDNQQCAIMARNILENNGLTSDITERVFNLIENRNWFDAYKQGKIDIEDIAVLFREPNDFELAKIISEQDFSIGKNKELSSQIEITLEKIYSKAPIVKPTKIPYEQIKFQKIKFNGDDYKVVDFTNSNLDLEALGFPKGIAKEQVRFLTHFMKIANKDNVNTRLSASSPELINILCDEVNNTSLSAALIDPLHIDVDVMGRNCAVVLEPMSSNYAAAYHEDFTSPLKKGYSEFKDYLTGKLTPEQREYTSNVYKKYLNLSDSEYIQFYKALSKLDDTSRIKSDIIINKGMPDERTISAIEIVEAIEYVNNSLSNITKNWNELIIYNPKIKALLYKIETPIKNNLLENCPKDLLEFAKKHNLPIFIIN